MPARRTLVVAVLLLVPLLAGGAHAQSAAQVGQWRTLAELMPINPIHVGLMHDGRILVVAGSENEKPKHDASVSHAAVYDWRSGTIAVQSLAWDLFCNGFSFLADGRALIIGGSEQYDPFFGESRATVFDPATDQFVEVESMADGRWYATGTTLNDGRVATFSGLGSSGNTNSTVEIYTVGQGWSAAFPAPWTPPLYPWLHLLPNGNLFYSGSTASSHVFDPVAHSWTLNVARTVYGATRGAGSSVLLGLRPETGYAPRVMIMGGNDPATASAEVIDLSAATPRWRALPPMSRARIQMNAVLLPDGKVLAQGGSAVNESAADASLPADLFNPVSETWAPAGVAAYARLYHSVALLLPDATVWTAGSNPTRGTYEQHMEIYSPPYLFTTDPLAGQAIPAVRPTIGGAPDAIGYGGSFQVATPDGASVASVVLVRPGSDTHAWDMEQRLVGLTFSAGAPGTLTVGEPPSANLAPPGWYMLFLVNRAGVPSMARFVRVSAAPANQPPRGTIVSPAGDVTIRAGQAVAFSATGVDPEGGPVTYAWIFPDGTPEASGAQNPGPVVFSATGSHIVSLTVLDGTGANDPSPPTRTVTVLPTSCGDGVVDAGEQCDDHNTVSGDCCSSTCQIEPAGTVCRAAAGPCDVAETCTGTSPSCPANAFAGAGTVCRASAGVCDVTEACTGSAAACPANAFLAAGTVCRAATGVCDVAEACSGSSAACPADAKPPNGTSCTDGNACNGAETCQAGACTAGAALACDDGNPCTDDGCDPAAGCTHASNAAACTDGSLCTTGDVCSAGTCRGTAVVCPAGQTCNPSSGVCGGIAAAWATQDVGAVGIAGSATGSGSAFSLSGSGNDIWDTADGFRFVYQPLAGNGQIVARVTGVANTNAWAKAGVMMRESLAAGSRHALMALTPGNGAAFQRRTATNAASAHTAGGAASAPLWVKLVRSGNTLTGYRSSDGLAWTQVGSDTVTMAATIYVGLAVTSHNNTAVCAATFDGVAVTAGPAPGGLPSPWVDGDVGSVGKAGSSAWNGSAFTVNGAGADIWNAADGFRFVYRPLHGDGTVVARVTGVQNTNAWAKAGVMIRESLAAGSRHAMMVLTPGNGAAFQRRTATGGASTHTAGGAAGAPLWVKVVRTGNTLAGYRSSNGTTWTLVGSDTVPMATDVLVGLAVTSHSSGVLCTATFDGVALQ